MLISIWTSLNRAQPEVMSIKNNCRFRVLNYRLQKIFLRRSNVVLTLINICQEHIIHPLRQCLCQILNNRTYSSFFYIYVNVIMCSGENNYSEFISTTGKLKNMLVRVGNISKLELTGSRVWSIDFSPKHFLLVHSSH